MFGWLFKRRDKKLKDAELRAKLRESLARYAERDDKDTTLSVYDTHDEKAFEALFGNTGFDPRKSKVEVIDFAEDDTIPDILIDYINKGIAKNRLGDK